MRPWRTLLVWSVLWVLGVLGLWPTLLVAGQRLEPAPPGAFSIVVIPDTQGYRGRGTKAEPASTEPLSNAALASHVRWIVANLQQQRIVFVSHVGDIVDKNVPEQWELARLAMDGLHGRVPYGIAPGNHDMTAGGNSSLFQRHFPASRFSGCDWYGGTFPGGGSESPSGNNSSSFQLFAAGGLEFVFLHLECCAPDDVLQWAGTVLQSHAHRRALITTHMGLGPLAKPSTERDFVAAPRGRMQWKKTHGPRGNTPEEMWQKCFRKHDNLFVVFSGDQSRTQAMHLVTPNDRGRPVHEIMSDYGEHWLRVCRFLPAADRIEVRTVDSRDGTLCEGTKRVPRREEHQFTIRYPMSAGTAH